MGLEWCLSCLIKEAWVSLLWMTDILGSWLLEKIQQRHKSYTRQKNQEGILLVYIWMSLLLIIVLMCARPFKSTHCDCDVAWSDGWFWVIAINHHNLSWYMHIISSDVFQLYWKQPQWNGLTVSMHELSKCSSIIYNFPHFLSLQKPELEISFLFCIA